MSLTWTCEDGARGALPRNSARKRFRSGNALPPQALLIHGLPSMAELGVAAPARTAVPTRNALACRATFGRQARSRQAAAELGAIIVPAPNPCNRPTPHPIRPFILIWRSVSRHVAARPRVPTREVTTIEVRNVSGACLMTDASRPCRTGQPADPVASFHPRRKSMRD